jgi:2-hydroxychromene-2-carboxylate isomerase
MPRLEFYFDFMSPYSYLAHCRIPAIAKRYGVELVYKPIDLKQAKLAAGNTAPPTVQMPPKQRYSFADLTRWSNRYGVPFTLPKIEGGNVSPSIFASERENVGTYMAIDEGRAGEYVSCVWDQVWGNGCGVGSDEVLTTVARAMGWSVDSFLAFVVSPATRHRYDQDNKAAHGRGVFGVPTMIIDDQLWWGNDRLDFMEEYLSYRAS